MTLFKGNCVYISSTKLRPLRNNLHVTYPDAPVYEADKTYNQVVSACLIHSPDGDFAITFCRAAEYVSILCWEESLNSVFMGLKLLLNHQALRVQHKDLPHNLTEAWPTTTTNPDLKKEKEETMSSVCVYGMTMEMSCKRSRLTWSFTLIIQVTQLQLGSMTHLGGLTGSLESHTQSSAESVKLVQICLFYKNT